MHCLVFSPCGIISPQKRKYFASLTVKNIFVLKYSTVLYFDLILSEQIGEETNKLLW